MKDIGLEILGVSHIVRVFFVDEIQNRFLDIQNLTTQKFEIIKCKCSRDALQIITSDFFDVQTIYQQLNHEEIKNFKRLKSNGMLIVVFGEIHLALIQLYCEDSLIIRYSSKQYKHSSISISIKRLAEQSFSY